MKKTIFLLLLSALFFNCSKDVDDTELGEQDFTVILNVDPNYKLSEFTESFRAFLSDQNGTILDSGELQIGESTTLSFSGEPSTIYDLSYGYYANFDIGGQEYYTFNTYSNIDQGEYTIYASTFIENTNDEIYINLNTTGYPCEVTSSTPGVGQTGPENGGYFNYRGNLKGSPTSDFYASFKSPNDQFDRYIWMEDVSEGSVFNIDYTTLPEIQNDVNVNTPSNTIYRFGLQGLVQADINNIYHSIREGNYPNGFTSISIPVPVNIFDSFIFNINFGDESFQYSKTFHTAIIPNTVSAPEMSLTVNNPFPDNFQMITTGDAGIYNVIFRGANADETVFVAHSIYGEVATEVSFSKENLRMNIQQNYPSLSGFETLPLGSVSLTHYSEISSYKDILKYRIQGKPYELPEGDYYESVFKQFD